MYVMDGKVKQLVAVARLGVSLGTVMVKHSHDQTPRKFTRLRLPDCVILWIYLKTTYGGIIEYLDVAGELRPRWVWRGRRIT